MTRSPQGNNQIVEQSREVKKVLGALEDLLIGKGNATQERQGEKVTVTKIHLLAMVDSVADLDHLDPLKYPRALVQDAYSYRLYEYVDARYVPVHTTKHVETLLLTSRIVSVKGLEVIVTGSSAPLTVTDLLDGLPGQVITLISGDGNLFIDHNHTIKLKAQKSVPVNLWGSVSLVFTGEKWVEV